MGPLVGRRVGCWYGVMVIMVKGPPWWWWSLRSIFWKNLSTGDGVHVKFWLDLQLDCKVSLKVRFLDYMLCHLKRMSSTGIFFQIMVCRWYPHGKYFLKLSNYVISWIFVIVFVGINYTRTWAILGNGLVFTMSVSLQNKCTITSLLLFSLAAEAQPLSQF